MKEVKWRRIRFMPSDPLGESRRTFCREHRELARRAAAEGMVLLKNEGELLPLADGSALAVFGKAQIDYVTSGGGSSSVTLYDIPDLLDALREKELQGRIRLFDRLSNLYKTLRSESACNEGHTEPDLSDELIAQARAFTDTALITISRRESEGTDRRPESYTFSKDETALIQCVSEVFPKCILCLNTGELISTVHAEDNGSVHSILLAWQAGGEGAGAIADVLLGDAEPEGRLTDTIAGSICDHPSAAGFFESDDYVEYNEDIFVGYRYYETIPGAKDSVLYPFGYGLGYTDFDMSFAHAVTKGNEITFVIKTANTGHRSGRGVVQVYCEPPRGRLDKSRRILVGFAKTGLLQPGKSETLRVSFNLRDLASYDETGLINASSFVLEHGKYTFYAGINVRDAERVDWSLTLNDDRVLEVLSPRCVPSLPLKLMREDGSFESVPAKKEYVPEDRSFRGILPASGAYPDEQYCHIPFSGWGPPTLPQFIDVAEGRLSLDDFMSALSDDQLVCLLGGRPNRGCANTFGVGDLPVYGIPNVMTADGPVGLRIKPECGVITTAFPCATALACSWDTGLMYEIGRAIGEEVKENGMGIWLGPAINIHRSPLCGRNFEYYSEDPLLTGKLASAMVKGAQSLGIAACPKHFAANNKETNRRDSDSRLSERALREIYLRAFEICVKEAEPLTLMCSYNILNGIRVSENSDLLTGILRKEWNWDGPVFTDWYTFGVQFREIAAGADLKMGCGMPEHTMEMIREGRLSMDCVRNCVRRVLKMILKLE
ncbi:MAG: glycoside hydrolase family 3 C-terminal domain-containing protein [Lachnospiraceae bacterium]|nr:glycoside hydrolase family 3 C-terminal domain-containing protein [Lachnospiraceae bacterium]